MHIAITNDGIIKLRPGEDQLQIINAAASVDNDDDGQRDLDLQSIRATVPDNTEATITIGEVEVTLNAKQCIHMLRKICRQSIRGEARRMAKLDDAMPEEIQ